MSKQLGHIESVEVSGECSWGRKMLTILKKIVKIAKMNEWGCILQSQFRLIQGMATQESKINVRETQKNMLILK